MNISRMTKISKIFLMMAQSLYTDHFLTQRQIRTMVLSGCAINLSVVIILITKEMVSIVIQCLI